MELPDFSAAKSAKFTDDKDLCRLIDVWVLRTRAMDLALGEAKLIEFLCADREMWSEIISNRYGAIAASFFGFGIITWTDSLQKTHFLAEEDGKPIIAMARLQMVDAAVQLILRVFPATNTVDARENVISRLYGAKGV